MKIKTWNDIEKLLKTLSEEQKNTSARLGSIDPLGTDLFVMRVKEALYVHKLNPEGEWLAYREWANQGYREEDLREVATRGDVYIEIV